MIPVKKIDVMPLTVNWAAIKKNPLQISSCQIVFKPSHVIMLKLGETMAKKRRVQIPEIDWDEWIEKSAHDWMNQPTSQPTNEQTIELNGACLTPYLNQINSMMPLCSDYGWVQN